MSPETTTEYCVMRDIDPPDDRPHRGPMSKDDAERWVREWDEMHDESYADRIGMFYVARRTVSPWEPA